MKPAMCQFALVQSGIENAWQTRLAKQCYHHTFERTLHARIRAHKLKQQTVGSMHSMMEKLPYWWTHESLVTHVLNMALGHVASGEQGSLSKQVLGENVVKAALEFTHLRLARGYNMLDVEISRGSWRRREGSTVRRTVGKYAQTPSELEQASQTLLRGCLGGAIFADTAGLHVARYRGVCRKMPCVLV